MPLIGSPCGSEMQPANARTGDETHVCLTKLDDVEVAPEPHSTLHLMEGALRRRSFRLCSSKDDVLRHLIARVPEGVERIYENPDVASQVPLGPSGRPEAKVQSAERAVLTHLADIGSVKGLGVALVARPPQLPVAFRIRAGGRSNRSRRSIGRSLSSCP